MTRTITLDLANTILDQLETEAKGRGMTPAQWIVLSLTERFTRSRTDELQPVTPSTPNPAGSLLIPSANDPRTGEEQEELRVRFRKHLGALNSGDPRSADNERIDVDLAREDPNLSAREV